MAADRHRFKVGQTDDGRWLAVSYRSPYFVFQAGSESEAEAIANRALDFYFGISGKIQNVAKRPQTLSSFFGKKIVEREAA